MKNSGNGRVGVSMEDSGIVEKLILFGLTRQEASVYLCLLTQGERNGYEVAKQTGISRSNVYSTLSSLTACGAAYLIEGASSKYRAVPVEEFCQNHIQRLEKEKTYLMENVPRPRETEEGYITIEGYRHVMDKIRNMLRKTQHRVYFSAAAYFLELWKDEIIQLLSEEKKVVLISERRPEGITDSNLILYVSGEQKERQIRLIVDSSQVLTGEIRGRENDNCLYCAQPNFVNVFKEAMGNEIKLIELRGNKS